MPSRCVVRGACMQEMGEEGNRFTRQLKETLFRLGFEPDQIGVRLVYSVLVALLAARVEGTCIRADYVPLGLEHAMGLRAPSPANSAAWSLRCPQLLDAMLRHAGAAVRTAGLWGREGDGACVMPCPRRRLGTDAPS